jgi:hypothetical protein
MYRVAVGVFMPDDHEFIKAVERIDELLGNWQRIMHN